MSTEIIKEITVDIYDRKIIVVTAKQYDMAARYLLVNCTNQGVFMPISNEEYRAYIRVRKADGFCCFNDCEITNEGKIKVELTEQILAANGNAYADIVIVGIVPDTERPNRYIGELHINGGSILSTIPIRINVVEAGCECWDIESSDEFLALNHLLIEVQNDYQEVIAACQEYYNGLEAFTRSIGNGVFSPKGSITFEELPNVSKSAGFVYHILDEFTTDDTFRTPDVFCNVGTNVYYTVDNKWDIFVGETIKVNDDNQGNVSLILDLF